MKNTISIYNTDARVDTADAWHWHDGVSAPDQYAIMNTADWLALGEAERPSGVKLCSEDEMRDISAHLSSLKLIALEFEDFKDGRSYSLAYLIRSRLGFKGDLRATGDVLRDQLAYMRQCGFSSFTVREDRSAEDALKGLKGISVTYSGSVSQPDPLYRRVHRS